MTRRERKQREALAEGSTYIPALNFIAEALAWFLWWFCYYPSRWRRGRNQSFNTTLDGGAGQIESRR